MTSSSKSPFPGTFCEDAYMRDLQAQEKSGMVVITDEHRKKNCIVLERVKDLLPLNDIYKVHDCDMVYRFLIGRHWKVDEAVSSFRLYAEMRKKEKINEVLGERFSDKLLSIVATAYGTDVAGRPVLWCSPDKSTVLSVMKEFSKEAIIRVHFRQMEQARFCALSQGKDRCTYVLDMKNLPVSSFLSPTYINFVMEVMKLLQNYYPEVMMKLIICNVNFAVNLGWSAVKRCVDSRIHEKLVFMAKPPGVAVLAPHMQEKSVHPRYTTEEARATRKKTAERGTSSPKKRDTITSSNEKTASVKCVSRRERENTPPTGAKNVENSEDEEELRHHNEIEDEITELLRIEAARITDCIQRDIPISPPPCARREREVTGVGSSEALLLSPFEAEKTEFTRSHSPASSPPLLRSFTSAPSLHVSLTGNSSFDGDIFSVCSEASNEAPSETRGEEKVIHEKEGLSAKRRTHHKNFFPCLAERTSECSRDDTRTKSDNTELVRDSSASSLCTSSFFLSGGERNVIEHDSKNRKLKRRKEKAHKKERKEGVELRFLSRGEEPPLRRTLSGSTVNDHERSQSPRTLCTTTNATVLSSLSVPPKGYSSHTAGALRTEEREKLHNTKTPPSIVVVSGGNEEQEQKAEERVLPVEGIATCADHRRHVSAFGRCTTLVLTYTKKDTVFCSYRGTCCARMEKSRVFASFPMEGIDHDDQDGMGVLCAFPPKPSAGPPVLEERKEENSLNDEDSLRTAFSTQGSFTSGEEEEHSLGETEVQRGRTRVHEGERQRKHGHPSNSIHQQHHHQQLPTHLLGDQQRQHEKRQVEKIQGLAEKHCFRSLSWSRSQNRYPVLRSNSIPSSSWVLCGELLHASGHYFHTTLLVCDGERRVNFILKCSNFHRRIQVYMVVGSNREVKTTADHTHFFPLSEKTSSLTGEPFSMPGSPSSTCSSSSDSFTTDTVGEMRRHFIHIGTVVSHRYASSTVSREKNGSKDKSSVSTVSCSTQEYDDDVNAMNSNSKVGREAWMMLGTKELVSHDRSALDYRCKSHPLPRRSGDQEMGSVGGMLSPTGAPSTLFGKGPLPASHRFSSVGSLHLPSSYTYGFPHHVPKGGVGGCNSMRDFDANYPDGGAKNASRFLVSSPYSFPTPQGSGVGSRALGDPSHFSSGVLFSALNSETENAVEEKNVRRNTFISKRLSSFSSLGRLVKHSVAKVLPFSHQSTSVMVAEHRDQVLMFYGDLALWYQPHDLFALGVAITSLWTG